MLVIDVDDKNVLISFNENTKINVLNADEIKKDLIYMVQIPNYNLTIDFTNIKFVDSKGIDVLIQIKNMANINDNLFKIINVSKEMHELFDFVKLKQIIEIVD